MFFAKVKLYYDFISYQKVVRGWIFAWKWFSYSQPSLVNARTHIVQENEIEAEKRVNWWFKFFFSSLHFELFTEAIDGDRDDQTKTFIVWWIESLVSTTFYRNVSYWIETNRSITRNTQAFHGEREVGIIRTNDRRKKYIPNHSYFSMANNRCQFALK